MYVDAHSLNMYYSFCLGGLYEERVSINVLIPLLAMSAYRPV